MPTYSIWVDVWAVVCLALVFTIVVMGGAGLCIAVDNSDNHTHWYS